MWSLSHNNSANSQYIKADVEANIHSSCSEYSLWTAHEQSAGWNLFTEEINEYFLDNEYIQEFCHMFVDNWRTEKKVGEI